MIRIDVCEDRSPPGTYHPKHWPETARQCICYTSSLLRHKHLRDPSARRSRAQGPSLATPQAIWIAFKHKHWPPASREPSKHTATLLACSTSCSRPNHTTTMSDKLGHANAPGQFTLYQVCLSPHRQVQHRLARWACAGKHQSGLTEGLLVVPVATFATTLPLPGQPAGRACLDRYAATRRQSGAPCMLLTY